MTWSLCVQGEYVKWAACRDVVLNKWRCPDVVLFYLCLLTIFAFLRIHHVWTSKYHIFFCNFIFYKLFKAKQTFLGPRILLLFYEMPILLKEEMLVSFIFLFIFTFQQMVKDSELQESSSFYLFILIFQILTSIVCTEWSAESYYVHFRFGLSSNCCFLLSISFTETGVIIATDQCFKTTWRHIDFALFELCLWFLFSRPKVSNIGYL